MYRIAQHHDGRMPQFGGKYRITRWVGKTGDTVKYPGKARTWKTLKGAQAYLANHPFLRNAEIEKCTYVV